jgi:hypothetical protein
MKTFLLVFCSFSLMATLTVFAYNSEKGPAKQMDGITELPRQQNDSLLNRGKHLIHQSKYSAEDLRAISAYLNNR